MWLAWCHASNGILAVIVILVVPPGANAWYRPASCSGLSCTHSIPANYQFAPGMPDSELSNADNLGKAVYLPWGFPFYGTTWGAITISTNGYILVGAEGNSFWGRMQNYWCSVVVRGSPCVNLRYRTFHKGGGQFTSYQAGIIAPFWHDFDSSAGGSVYHGRRTDALHCGDGRTDCYIIEWWRVQANGSSAPYTFELKLFPSGDFEFHYRNVNTGGPVDGGTGVTVGYQQAPGTVGHSLKAADLSMTIMDGTAKRFIRPRTAGYFYSADLLSGLPRRWLGIEFWSSSGIVHAFTESDGWANTWGAAGWGPIYAAWITGYDLFGREVYRVAAPLDLWENEGSFLYMKDSKVSPQSSGGVDFPICYPDWGTATSRLEQWSLDGVNDKPLLIVPGIDNYPHELRNGDHPSRWIVGLGAILGPLYLEGYDVAIGDYGRGDSQLGTLAETHNMSSGVCAGSFGGDFQRWLESLHAAAGKRVMVAGASMGGVVSRIGLANQTGNRDKVRSWFSLDAPQRGANTGGGGDVSPAGGGIQCLIFCSEEEAARQQLFTEPAPALNAFPMFGGVCSDPPWPEDHSCPWFRSGSMDALLWPPGSTNGRVLNRYGIALGSGRPNVTEKSPNLALLRFHYSGLSGCGHSNGDWVWREGELDCLSGSKYFDPTCAAGSGAFGTPCIDRHKELDEPNGWWPGNCTGAASLDVQYRPTFISTASALRGPGVIATPANNCRFSQNVTSLSGGPNLWTDWVAGDVNYFHTQVPGPGTGSVRRDVVQPPSVPDTTSITAVVTDWIRNGSQSFACTPCN